MRFIFFFLLIFPSSRLFAKISNYSEDSKEWISSYNCEELKTQVQSLIDWNFRFKKDQQLKLSDFPCEKEISNVYRIDITKLMPEFLKDYESVCPLNGPNCWNAALVSAGLVGYPRYTSETEFRSFVDSPFCNALSSKETPQAGDVVAIRKKDKSEVKEVHAYIYLSKDLCFTKNGNGEKDRVGLDSAETVLYGYGVRDSLCNGISPDKIPSHCQQWSSYYRCISLSEFFEKYPHLKTKYSCYLESLDQLNIALGRVDRFNRAKEVCPLAKTFYSELESIIEETKENNNLKNPEKKLRQVIKESAHSTQKQIQIIKDTNKNVKDDY